MSTMSNKSKKWSGHENLTLFRSLENGERLRDIQDKIPSRSGEAIRIRANKWMYAGRRLPDGDIQFHSNIKLRNRQPRRSDKSTNFPVPDLSDSIRCVYKNTEEILSKNIQNNQGSKDAILEAIGTLENAGYPVEICAVALLVNLGGTK